MRYLFFSFIILLSVSVASSIAQAANSSFGIHLIGPSDTESPTTPVLISATPVASTQIDIDWNASTDNAVVSGYVVFRDGNPIATTTLLTYADTGLVASTTYGYAVRAFDAYLNYSSSSNSIATTTLEAPIIPVIPVSTSSPQGGTATKVVLRSFEINTGESTATFSLSTALPARIEVRWGRTASYELGYVVGGIYKTTHEVYLSDLEPNTTYVYEVVGFNARGLATVLKTGSFATMSDLPTAPPGNVSRFEATASLSDVRLSWGNPVDVEVSRVRIVRSYLGFPTHPNDGAIVYQGLNTNAVDIDILATYSPVYYTAFVYDTFGNISSGAVAIAYADNGGGNLVGPGSIPPKTTEATSSIDKSRLTPDMKMPLSSDITVIQQGNKYSMLEAPIRLSHQEDFVVFIPIDTVAGHLKSIILTVVDPTDNRKAYSYLLRINNDRTAYVATVPGLNVVGDSRIRVEIFDYEAFVVGNYQTPLQFIDILEVQTDKENNRDFAWGIAYGIFAVLILILTGAIIFLLYKRSSEDKK
ncbi:hypothetical protein H6785_00610 [Candidatus Nomurabacteria bacterium]|nr:hypothetical protein [Candidatus Nomurabacteria bacterium]